MPAAALKPNIGVCDQLGTQAAPWQAGYIKVLFDDQGNAYAKIPISGSSISGGIIAPAVLAQLLSTAVISDLANLPLLTVVNNAALGALDPVARINAGSSLINGSKVQGGSFSLASIDATVALAQLLKIANGGAWQSDDYAATTFPGGVPTPGAGFKIGKGVIDLCLGTIAALLIGTINIANRFSCDAGGNCKWGDPVGSPLNLHGIDANGQEWWGSDNWADAPLQVDIGGNLYVTDTQFSHNSIDLGAINAICRGIVPSQAGGQLPNGQLTLTPQTRGSSIYYTTNGSDPSDVTNVNRFLYAAAIPIVLGGGATLTIKAVATKLGVNSAVFTWVFTGDPGTCAAPTMNPIPGSIVTNTGQQAITLASGTPGATITYTKDGTTPNPGVNGIVYVAPFNIGPGQVLVQAIASKAGLANSGVTLGFYNITKGGGQGGTGGHNP